MWRLELAHRTNPEILDHGLICVTRLSTDCQADLGYGSATVFPGLDYPTPWYIPKSFEYRALFGGRGGSDEPLARLNSLGVRDKGEQLKGPTYLWLRGDFYLRKHQGDRHLGFDQVDRVDAIPFKLVPGATTPQTETWKLGFNCGITTTARPTCQSFDRGLGADILWFRRMSDAEGGDYWCQPGKQSSWDPARC
jgi:hypothetical protein